MHSSAQMSEILILPVTFNFIPFHWLPGGNHLLPYSLNGVINIFDRESHNFLVLWEVLKQTT